MTGPKNKTREDYEQEERNLEFMNWWRRHGVVPVSRLPPQQQHTINKLVKAAYMKGGKVEAQKHEPIRVGGVD